MYYAITVNELENNNIRQSICNRYLAVYYIIFIIIITIVVVFYYK